MLVLWSSVIMIGGVEPDATTMPEAVRRVKATLEKNGGQPLARREKKQRENSREAPALLVVTAVASDPSGEDGLAGGEVHVLGAVEDDDLAALLVLFRAVCRDLLGGLVCGSDTGVLLALSTLELALLAAGADEDLFERLGAANDGDVEEEGVFRRGIWKTK